MGEKPETTNQKRICSLAWPYAIAVAAISVVPFLPALSGEFLNWDDLGNFLENPHYRGLGPANLHWMFTESWHGHYVPLTWLTHGLDYVLWGMDPRGYHAVNLLLHAVNAILVFLLTLQLVTLASCGRGEPAPTAAGRSRPEGRSYIMPAALAALFWAVHPLRVESVAWITERRDVLAACFYFAAVLFYLRAHDPSHSPAGNYAGSVACMLLSMGAKAWAVTLPAVLLVVDVYPLRRRGWTQLLVEKIPFVLIAAGGAWAAGAAQGGTQAFLTWEEYGPHPRVMQSMYGLGFYLAKTFAPFGLSPLYLLPEHPETIPERWVYGAAVAVVVTAAAFLLRRRAPGLLAAWAAAVAIVLPVLGLVQTGPQEAADRYTYLAAAPGSVVLAGLLARGGKGVAGIALAALAGLAVMTWNYSAVWARSETLWAHAVEVDPGNREAQSMLAMVREKEGDFRAALERLDRLVAEHPDRGEVYSNRGSVRHQMGDLEGAARDYDAAIRLAPDFAPAFASRSALRAQQGDYTGAEADALRAVQLDPRTANAWVILANLRMMRRDVAGAKEAFDRALESDPGHLEARLNRIQLHLELKNFDAARADAQAIRESAPPHWPYWGRLEKLEERISK